MFDKTELMTGIYKINFLKKRSSFDTSFAEMIIRFSQHTGQYLKFQQNIREKNVST